MPTCYSSVGHDRIQFRMSRVKEARGAGVLRARAGFGLGARRWSAGIIATGGLLAAALLLGLSAPASAGTWTPQYGTTLDSKDVSGADDLSLAAVASSASGVVAAAWIKNQTVYVSRYVDHAWTSPVQASDTADIKDRVAVVVAPDGAPTVAWRVVSGSDSYVQWHRFNANGTSAQGGNPLAISLTSGLMVLGGPLLGVASDGVVTAGWSHRENASTDNFLTIRRSDAGTSSTLASSTTFDIQAQGLTVAADGSATVAWQKDSDDRTVVMATRYASGTASPSVALSLDEAQADADDAVLAVDGSGTVTALWVADRTRVEASRFTAGTWSTRTTISASDATNLTVTANAAGDVVASWIEVASLDTVKAAWFGGGTWSAPGVVSEGSAGEDYERSGQSVVLDAAGEATVAWTVHDANASPGFTTVAARGTASGWGPRAPLAAAQDPAYIVDPHLAVDGDGVVTALWGWKDPASTTKDLRAGRYVTAPTAPTAVAATPGDQQAAVTWTAPSDDGGAPIGSYTATAAPGGAACTSSSGSPVTAGCTITGLDNGSTYTITVTATTAGGTSEASAASAPVTPRTTPGAPTSVRATAGSGRAFIAWTAPGDDGGNPIATYVATAVEDNTKSCTWTSGPLECTVGGLVNGTSYTFAVTATNGAGSGLASRASAPAIQPSAVIGLTRPTITGEAVVGNALTAGDGTWDAAAGTPTITRQWEICEVGQGLTWSSETPAAANSWNGVTWGGPDGRGLFVAVGASGTNTRVMTSPEGATWTTRHSPVASGTEPNWKSVTWGGPDGAERFVAVATTLDGNQVMTSPDGITWTLQTTPARSGGGTTAWQSVTWGAGRFVAVATDRVMTSSDGATWTEQILPDEKGWRSVVWGGQSGAEMFVAVGNDAVMTSVDGTTWTAPIDAPGANNWQSATWGGEAGSERFVAVAGNGSGDSVMTSTDGATWTAQSTVGNDQPWRSIVWGGLDGTERFYAVSARGAGTADRRVMTSPDGISWSGRPAAADQNWVSVAVGGPPSADAVLVSVANNGGSGSPAAMRLTADISCSSIAGETGATYTPRALDVVDRIRLTVTADDGSSQATQVSLISAAVVAAAAPTNTSPPTLSGAARAGATLTATGGGWTGAPAPTVATRWQRCDATGSGCADIAGASSSTYVLVAADAGSRIRVVETATNFAGAVEVPSVVTGVVEGLPTTPADPVQPPAQAAPTPEDAPPTDPCAALTGIAKSTCAARVRKDAAVQRAQAVRDAALAKCGTKKGAAKASCATKTRAAYTRTVAVAKAAQTRDVALARCGSKKGAAKASCVRNARASYARSVARAKAAYAKAVKRR